MITIPLNRLKRVALPLDPCNVRQYSLLRSLPPSKRTMVVAPPGTCFVWRGQAHFLQPGEVYAGPCGVSYQIRADGSAVRLNPKRPSKKRLRIEARKQRKVK